MDIAWNPKRIHRFSIPGLPRGAFCKEAGSGSCHWMDLWEHARIDGNYTANSVIQHYWSRAFNVLKKVLWVCRLLGPLWPPIAHSFGWRAGSNDLKCQQSQQKYRLGYIVSTAKLYNWLYNYRSHIFVPTWIQLNITNQITLYIC